jgi:hypothetical protein
MPDARTRLRQALERAVHEHQNEAMGVVRRDPSMGCDAVVLGER